jgi:hypothetical protein
VARAAPPQQTSVDIPTRDEREELNRLHLLEPPLDDQIARIVMFRVSKGMTNSPAQLITNLVDSLVEAGPVPPIQATQLVTAVTQKVGAVVDMTPPVTTAAVSPQPNSAGWNNSNVTIPESWLSLLKSGGREGIRTLGLLVANEAKSKLRHGVATT